MQATPFPLNQSACALNGTLLTHAQELEAATMSALRRVLLLGSGYTSGPLVECLTRAGTVSVTVGEAKFDK